MPCSGVYARHMASKRFRVAGDGLPVGVFAWQVWRIVHFYFAAPRAFACARRAFHAAGVGNGVTCCVAGHRFAWQAQGRKAWLRGRCFV